MNWMKKSDTARYEKGICSYLEEKGHIERLVEFQWGYVASVLVGDDYRDYSFEYQGDDQFAVQYKWVDFEDMEYDGDGFGPEYTERCGFIEIK